MGGFSGGREMLLKDPVYEPKWMRFHPPGNSAWSEDGKTAAQPANKGKTRAGLFTVECRGELSQPQSAVAYHHNARDRSEQGSRSSPWDQFYRVLSQHLRGMF